MNSPRHTPLRQRFRVVEGDKKSGSGFNNEQYTEDWPLQSPDNFAEFAGVEVTEDDLAAMRDMLDYLRNGHLKN